MNVGNIWKLLYYKLNAPSSIVIDGVLFFYFNFNFDIYQFYEVYKFYFYYFLIIKDGSLLLSYLCKYIYIVMWS